MTTDQLHILAKDVRKKTGLQLDNTSLRDGKESRLAKVCMIVPLSIQYLTTFSKRYYSPSIKPTCGRILRGHLETHLADLVVEGRLPHKPCHCLLSFVL